MSTVEFTGTKSQATADKAVTPRSRRGEPAWELAELYPRQGEWTEQEFLALDRWCEPRFLELTDGYLDVLPYPSPIGSHQIVVAELLSAFNDALRGRDAGYLVPGPCPIRLRAGLYRTPDLFVVGRNHMPDVHDQPTGADLVVEVLSEEPWSRERDLVLKQLDYQEARIPEYWLVDPVEQWIKILTLKDEQYQVHGKFHRDKDVAASVLLSGFSVDINNVFSRLDRFQKPENE